MMRRISFFFVLVGVFLFFAARVVSFAGEPSANKKELQRIKRQMLEKKKEIKRAGRKEHSILTELDRIDREIHTGKASLAAQENQLQATETALSDVEKSNAEINRQLVGLKQAYAGRLRALYKMSRNGYVDVLAADAPGDPFKRVKYLTMIAERDQLVMRDYARSLDLLAAQETTIAAKRQSLLEQQRSIAIRKNELESRKRKKAVLLASVRQEKGVYEQTLHELEESSTNLWAMVKKSEQERTAALASKAEPRVAVARQSGNRFPWPVEGQVLTKFGMQRHPQFNIMVFRRGIEIAVREGEPVRSVSDGQVVWANWYKGYGNLMIIEHGPGFYTLYGNLSQLDLKEGDRVARGQVIGLAGDTGSLKGAKLYFEMRRNGEAQDPLLWLAKR